MVSVKLGGSEIPNKSTKLTHPATSKQKQSLDLSTGKITFN